MSSLPNLRLDEFREIDFLENELDMEVFVEPTIPATRIHCPHCGSVYTISHGAEERFFRDINMYEKRVGVAVQGKRYKCKDCKKTFALEFDCIDPNGKISRRLKETIQKKALNRTFTSVAEEYGLGVTTVLNAFNEYSDILNLRPQVKAPRVLGIDECHLQKVMRPVYVDVENATILEMGRSIKQKDVIRDLEAFEDLSNVEVVITDMNQGYRGAIQTLFPQAVHVVDKFHVIKLFINAVEDARKKILEYIRAGIHETSNRAEKERQERILAELNVDAFMFKMNPENMSDWRFERLTRICETYPLFAELAALRRGFYRVYECDSKKEAVETFCNWRKTIPKSPIYTEMTKFASRTVPTWLNEVFAYFDVEGRKTNAVTERLNGAIKSMQNMGRGYSYQVLRAKMLFGSAVAKAPIYQRISKMENANQDQVQMFISRFHGKDDEAEYLSVFACDGGGVVEPPEYYGGKAAASKALDVNDIYYREMHIHDNEPYEWDGSRVRNPEFALKQNGGALIDKVIDYYHLHGECI